MFKLGTSTTIEVPEIEYVLAKKLPAAELPICTWINFGSTWSKNFPEIVILVPALPDLG
jgi:hypothetical protein